MLLQEWGDPRKEEYYFYMKSYSPVDNVSRNFMNHNAFYFTLGMGNILDLISFCTSLQIAAQNYPAILITAGLNGKSKIKFYHYGM